MLKRNRKFSKELLKKLKGNGYKSESGKETCGIWIKEVNDRFDILFNRDWLTFAIRIKPSKDDVEEAKKIIGNDKFDRDYKLTKLNEKLQYGIWAFRYFIDNVCDNKTINNAFDAFTKLEDDIKHTAGKGN